MAKFNPGDRVRLLPALYRGEEATVLHDDGEDILPLKVAEGDSEINFFDYAEVELVKSAGV